MALGLHPVKKSWTIILTENEGECHCEVTKSTTDVIFVHGRKRKNQNPFLRFVLQIKMAVIILLSCQHCYKELSPSSP